MEMPQYIALQYIHYMNLDESDWLGGSDKSDEEEEEVKEQPRGRGGRGAKTPEKKEERKKKEEVMKQEAAQSKQDTSFWLEQFNQNNDPPAQAKATRGKEYRQDMSFNLQGGEELQPDKQIETTWLAPSVPQTGRGNRQPNKQQEIEKEHKEEEEESSAPRRGNRERNEPANFHKKPAFDTDSHDTNTNRNYNNNGYNNRGDGYRGRGRGRGQGNNRGGYRPREGQSQSGGWYSRNNQDNEYKKRDNQQERARNNQQEQDQAPKRGNRVPRNDNYNNSNYNYNNRRENNRQNNNYPRNNQYNNNRDYNNTDREYNNNRSQYNNRDRDYNDNRDREFNNSNREGKESAFSKKSYFEKNQPEPILSRQVKDIKNVQKEKQEQLIPKGRRCWPESSIYVLGCRFTITYRPITEFRTKLLVIPYASLKMEYYPGNIINSSEVDYKARILAKGEQVSSPGSVYLQKAISIGSFVGLAFLKIDEKRVQDSLKVGIKRLLGQIENVDGPVSLQSLIFPICDQLGGTETVLTSFIQNLQNCKRVREVYITTNQSDCFMDSMKLFVELVQEMLDENKILIN